MRLDVLVAVGKSKVENGYPSPDFHPLALALGETLNDNFIARLVDGRFEINQVGQLPRYYVELPPEAVDWRARYERGESVEKLYFKARLNITMVKPEYLVRKKDDDSYGRNEAF